MTARVATVFGWAGAEPGSTLYMEGVKLGEGLSRAGYTVRCGGYFGLMEAVARGAREAGGRCVGICLDMFGDKPSNSYVTDVERAADLFDRLRSLIVGSDILIAQHGSLGTVAEVAVAWCLRYLAHPEVGDLHLVGDGWVAYHASLRELKVAAVDAACVQLHPNVNALLCALPHDTTNPAPAPRSAPLSFREGLARLDAGLAAGCGMTVELVGVLGAKDAVEFGNGAEGGLELQQRPEEIVPLIELLIARYRGAEPLRYLEVGLGHGGTSILVARALAAVRIEVRLTGIDDLSYERDGWLHGQRERLRWCEAALPLRLLEGSLRERTIRDLVAAEQYDVVLLDADHSHLGCLFDVLAVIGSLHPEGTLILHDIADAESPGVARVLKLLEPHFARTDRFADGGSCGIAALHRPAPTLDILDLLSGAV
jgi:uncharacterized protein (TIGR00725 family)